MTEFRVETIASQHAAVVRADVPQVELAGVFHRAFQEVVQVAGAQGVGITGPPFGYYPRMPAATVEVAAGFPVSAPITPVGEVTPMELPGGRVITGIHVGSFDGLATTYQELMQWAAAEGHELAGYMWESYLSDPAAEPDSSTWRTLITWPLA